MRWLLGTACVTGVLLLVGLFTSAGQGEPPAVNGAKPGRTLTASGSGTVKVNADAARITVKLEASGNDIKSAREALDKHATKLKDALEALKLGVEVRALPVEIAQQNNNFGFGGGGFAPPGVPMLGIAPALPPALPPVPLIPLPAPPQPDRDNNFIIAQDRAPALAPAPARDPVQPRPPVREPAAAPDPARLPPRDPLLAPEPAPGIGIQPPMFRGTFQLSQTLIITLKNADAAKLLDGVNKTQFAAVDAGVVVGAPNNNNGFPQGQIGFGGGGIIGGGFQGMPAAQAAGPRVVFFHTSDKETRRKALELAVADATANAQAMAKGAAVKILDTIAISDPPTSATGQSLIDYGNMPGNAENTGELEITVKVTVTCSY